MRLDKKKMYLGLMTYIGMPSSTTLMEILEICGDKISADLHECVIAPLNNKVEVVTNILSQGQTAPDNLLIKEALRVLKEPAVKTPGDYTTEENRKLHEICAVLKDKTLNEEYEFQHMVNKCVAIIEDRQ